MIEDRNQMIVNHLPLVAFVVNRMPSEGAGAVGIDREDAISYGVEGLIHAVDAYDPNRGTTFASFAIQRIRGSVLDAVRKQDPLPRSLRRNAKGDRACVAGASSSAWALANAEGNRVQAGNPVVATPVPLGARKLSSRFSRVFTGGPPQLRSRSRPGPGGRGYPFRSGACGRTEGCAVAALGSRELALPKGQGDSPPPL